METRALLAACLAPGFIRGTEVPQVVYVRRSLRSLFERGLEAQKEACLGLLRKNHPNTYVWFDVVNDELAAKAQRDGWCCPAAHLCQLPDSVPSSELYRDLYRGGWMVLFCDRPLEAEQAKLSYLATPAEVRAALQDPVRAIIVSWLDDSDWLIGWRDAPEIAQTKN